jgi:holo-[acyl-carrier protein] synthase
MPLRPFPYPFSIGTDICHINRIFTLLCRPQGSNQINQCKLEQFLNKCLTGVEIDLFRKHGPPSHQEWKVASHLAGR